MSKSRAEVQEVRIKIGGPAGFGIKAAGQTLARLFARTGFFTFDLTEYPSLIKGGHNAYHLRVSPEPIFSHVEPVDILVALDLDTVQLHADELAEGAALIWDPADFPLEEAGPLPEDLCPIPVPLAQIVRDARGQRIMRNTAALGAVLGYLGFPVSYLVDSIEEQFSHKAPEIAEHNATCARAGWEFAHDHGCAFPVELAPQEGRPVQILVDGNEAVGLGALAAGIGTYCAYPMTPASSLLHFMARHGDAHNVVVKHTEDEIAAMNMVVGAAFGGARAMCATSGGGFSLMVEAFGLAGVSESAVVVGVFTRPGPATGLPTWTEQSDVRFVIHAAQGEFPRVVLAPGDREDAFRLTWQAFNLADQLQTPVVILGDAYLSDNRQSIPVFDTSAIRIERGEIITEGSRANYLRYQITESGISPRAIPGLPGAQQIVNSYDHDEHGWASESADMRIAQNDKRMRKLDLARELVPKPAYFGPDHADVSLIVFGSTKMPAREAIAWMAKRGVAVNMLQVVTLWPFPTSEVTDFLGSAKRTLCLEGNHTGQLQSLIREHCLVDVDHSVRRYDGRPFSPERICAAIEEVL